MQQACELVVQGDDARGDPLFGRYVPRGVDDAG